METVAKSYGLEARTYDFARSCRTYVQSIASKNLDADQLIRSSGSVASNFIEAVEALSKKDFRHRIMICRKEAKESLLWLKLLDAEVALLSEAEALMKIFGSIYEKNK
jgi:four helix bundle protein